MTSFGIHTKRKNPNSGAIEDHYSIAAEVVWDGGRKDRGIFTYCLTKNNEIYHRFFTDKAPEQMVDELVRKGFYEYDFPALEDSAVSEKSRKGPSSIHNESYVLDSRKKNQLVIRDERNKAKIIILKVK